MNENFKTLMNLTKATLEQEYKDYSNGYLFVLANLIDGGTSVRYIEVQSKVIDVIKSSRQVANQLNEYFDSDASLANSLIDYIIDDIAIDASSVVTDEEEQEMEK
ncbi:hypothetical protein [Ruminiclostridium cellulolyticum]|uniref:Uncharacterized protein n=1 Tax=Ruminiclostridium cellulolyticum (strain ATCC 35319 / DSM 5812 / JCM 6584 / H10) TaxID=394503 RepID=B8I0E0_RUMCH|nr:hypothetical protein [Ruminiclostridium cellulolyticum]ACL77466.1 hypothetical protein Ccel_3175 [Ruminiclostridium cellulolyticum H10]